MKSNNNYKSKDCPKNEYLGWDKLVKKLEKEGYSKDYADKVAGKIKKEKYGK